MNPIKILLILLSATNVCYANTISTIPPTNNHEAATLKYYLTNEGNKLDCYFTLESDSMTSYHFNQVSDKRFTGIVPDYLANKDIQVNDPTSINQLIDQLQAELPGIDIYRDVDNKKIVHLEARSLQQDDKYVMNRLINVNETMIREDLPDYVGRKLNVSISNVAYFLTPLNERPITTLKRFVANQVPVRELFAQHISLTAYQRIIWTSEANLPVRSLFPHVRVEYYRKN